MAVVTRIRSAHLGVTVEVGDSGRLAEDNLTFYKYMLSHIEVINAAQQHLHFGIFYI